PVAAVNALDGVASYLWDFGDGSTSTLQSPNHTYALQGAYTVKLFITTKMGCSDSSVAINGILTGTEPAVDFKAAPLTQCEGQNIQFTDLSSSADHWSWNFGDGGFSALQDPIYAYK